MSYYAAHNYTTQCSPQEYNQTGWSGCGLGMFSRNIKHCNLVIFRIENISYIIILYSFNFVRSPYHTKHV